MKIFVKFNNIASCGSINKQETLSEIRFSAINNYRKSSTLRAAVKIRGSNQLPFLDVAVFTRSYRSVRDGELKDD